MAYCETELDHMVRIIIKALNVGTDVIEQIEFTLIRLIIWSTAIPDDQHVSDFLVLY